MIKLFLFSLIGVFGETFQGPGYVDLSPKSPLYIGNKNLKKNPDTPSKILSQIFKENKLRTEYFDDLLAEYEENLNAISSSLCLRVLGKCEKDKIEEELSKNIDYRASLKIIKLLKDAKELGKTIYPENLNSKEAQNFLNSLFTSLRIRNALKNGNFGNFKKNPPELLDFIKSRFLSQKIFKEKTEASNIPMAIDKDDLFFSPELLKSFKNDISLLDPVDGFFWKKPNWEIKSYELDPLSYKDLISLDEDSKNSLLNTSEVTDFLLDQNEPVTGYLPEITVSYAGEKWKLRFPVNIQDRNIGNDLKEAFNLFFQSNLINANPMAISMARALGFNVEPVIFKEKIRVFFQGEGNFLDKKAELLERLSRKFPIQNYAVPFLNHKTDEDSGKFFFELKGVTLQKINPEKVGVNPLFSAENIFRREFRGFALFLAWIDDIGFDDLDVTIDGMEKISDLSLSFGRGLPNYLKSDLVRKHSIAFKPLNSKNLLSSMTISDAKWMLNKILEFTPEQLNKGFIKSGFPPLVAQIFVRKLIKRRNQLVELLGISPGFFAKGKEWEGKIEGFEQYFSKKGELQDFKFTINDSNKENYPVNWSSTWMPHKGDVNRASLKKLSLVTLNTGLTIALRTGHPAIGFSNKEFKWRELRFKRKGYGPLCVGNCFYEGVEIGGTAFVPQRIIIKNPDPNSVKNFLVLEVFRIAIDSHIGQNIEQLIGLAPLPVKIGGGVSGFYVYEFIRIRPIAEVMPLMKDVKSLFKLPLFSFQKFRDEWLDSADEGDIMILSSYLGLEGALFAGPPALLSIVSVLGGVTSRMALINRLVLRKMENKIFNANWGNLKDYELAVVFGYDLYHFTDDWWIKAKANWTKKKDNIYQFDLSNDQERKYLVKNLSALAPLKIPDHLKLKKRGRRTSGASFYIGLMESLSFGIGSDFGFQSITDYLENKKMEQYYFERIKIKKFKGEYFETFRSYLDENQKTRLKITYAMETPKFTRDDLPPRLLEIGNILGFKLIPYDFEKIDFDMGSVSFLGSILFSPEAVEKIISLSEKDICNSYLNAQEDFENLWRCQDKKYSLSLAAFLKDFDQIKRAKIKLDEKDSKNKIYWYLKNFTDLLSRYGEKRGTVGILKKFLNPSDYFEMAFMLSDREPFPGSTSEILLASPGKNGHYPSIVEIADTNADSFALFSDKIIEAVGPYFYYNYKPKGVNRSEEIMNEIFSKIKFSYR